MAAVAELGGVVPAVESGYLKAQLVASHAARRARIESGEEKVVGVNCFQATEPSPLTVNADTAVYHVDPAYERAVARRPGRMARQARRGAAYWRPSAGCGPRRPARTST